MLTMFSLLNSAAADQRQLAYSALPQSDSAELEPGLRGMDAVSTEDMRRRGASGMFVASPHQRARIHQALDLRNHAVAIDEPLAQSDQVLDAAYRIGVLTEKTNRSVWHNTRFWRFTCGLLAASVFALVALLVYWIVNIGNSVSATLDSILFANPTIIQDTVTDARSLLHGAAVASSGVGQVVHTSRPALVNLTHSSAGLLASIATLMQQPKVTIDLGGRAASG